MAEYLTEEVLAHLDPGTRRFLTRTSILERFCAPVCNAVVGEEGSAARLEEMAHSNLFLVPLDEERCWYRYHHIFSDLLRAELARAEPDLASELHRRAGEWHRAFGTVDEAVHHLLAAEDWTGAEELVAESWLGYVNEGRLPTIRHWLDQVPDEVIGRHHGLLAAAAFIAALSGQRERCAHWLALADASDHAGPVPGGFRSLRSVALLVHCFGFSDFGTARAAAAEVEDLEPDPSSPWHATASLFSGLVAYLAGEGARARDALERAARASRDRLPVVEVTALAQLSLLACDRGRLDEAEELARAARRTVEEHNLSGSPQVSPAFTALGRVLAGRGRLAEALVELQRGLDLRHGVPFLSSLPTVQHLMVHAPVRFAAGDGDGARALIDEARGLLDAHPDATHLRELVDRIKATMDRATQRSFARGEALSPAESAVLELLPEVPTQRQIGARLHLSPHTVKSHVRAIYRKLGVSSRGDAVARAREAGLL